MPKKAKSPAGKRVEALRHEEAKRRNIPTAEYQSVVQKEAEPGASWSQSLYANASSPTLLPGPGRPYHPARSPLEHRLACEVGLRP